MRQKTLGGADGIQVGAIGLGCMNLTGQYGNRIERSDAERVLNAGIDAGMTLLDTSDFYSHGANEEFVGSSIKRRRDEITLCTKFGLLPGPPPTGMRFRADPAYVREACDASLRRLGVDHIDVWYLHRVDPAVPLADTYSAMAAEVERGTVRHLGLCEVTAGQLKEAHEIHPVTALQSEWSLWSREIEAEIVPAARSLGIGIVPFAPLGRGFFAGTLRGEQDFNPNDSRSLMPRLSGEHLKRNVELLRSLESIAGQNSCTSSQLALAWLDRQGDDVVAIPGSDRIEYIEQNCAALDLQVGEDTWSAITGLFANSDFGDRYPDMSLGAK